MHPLVNSSAWQVQNFWFTLQSPQDLKKYLSACTAGVEYTKHFRPKPAVAMPRPKEMKTADCFITFLGDEQRKEKPMVPVPHIHNGCSYHTRSIVGWFDDLHNLCHTNQQPRWSKYNEKVVYLAFCTNASFKFPKTWSSEVWSSWFKNLRPSLASVYQYPPLRMIIRILTPISYTQNFVHPTHTSPQKETLGSKSHAKIYITIHHIAFLLPDLRSQGEQMAEIYCRVQWPLLSLSRGHRTRQ